MSDNDDLIEQKLKTYETRNVVGAVKNDAMKPRMSLVPQVALIEVAKVMTYGAEKYKAYNWMDGFNWTVLTDAAIRHLAVFLAGEDKDDESGLLHLAHAACCCLMAIENCMLYPEKDDRWPGWQDEQKKRVLALAKEAYRPSEFLTNVLEKKKATK